MKKTITRSLLCGLSTVVLTVGLGGCKDLTGTQSLPSGVQSPSYYSTPAGAIGMRNAADSIFRGALIQYLVDAGLISDELEKSYVQGTSSGIPILVTNSLDQRILFPQEVGDGDASYNALQHVRGATNQAIGALATYYPAASPALRGQMYALQGYAEIMLADLFCSGIPLSTLDFNGDFTYHAGSSKEQVYQDAIAKFDTALALSGDSTRIMNLARVGLGRAQLALGHYAEAAQAVASVPDLYQYQVTVQWNNIGSGSGSNLNGIDNEVSNIEGENGLAFISSGDPRTTEVNSIVVHFNGRPVQQLHIPIKYQDGLTSPFYSPVTLADWIEVRLIRAEYALATNDTVTWLSELNYLRQNATVSGQTGTLAPLSNPSSDTARVSLMFQERAYWLYMTGHRQGDLRRLVRQYHRNQSKVYPTGDYLPSGQGGYGNDVTVPIPSSESPNSLFTGCIDRNA